MSETTGGAPPPPSGDTTGDSYAPPPNSQPAVSLSDAARLLRNARRAQASADSANGPTQPGIGHNSGAPPGNLTVANQPAAPDAPAAPRGVAALEAALGLGVDPGDVSRETPDQPAQPSPLAEGIELGGRRWTQAELQAELSKASDYTHKTQQLAAQARELQAQQQALAQFLPLVQPELEALQRRLAESPRPDPALRQVDPAAYWDQFAQWQDAQHEQQRVLGIMQMQQQARDAAMQQQVEISHQQLAQKYPFWSDPAQRREIQDNIVAWARGKGYTDAELQNLTSARYLETLFMAWQYERMAKGARTTAARPAVAQAPPRGAALPPAPAQAVLKAEQAFDSKPDWRNGAALIGARRAGNRGNGHSQW